MTKDRIYLFDTTLRDGQQTPGIDFSVEDKIAIARMLDEFGIDYVEGGYPGANPTDTAFFAMKRTVKASFVAFGMTKRAGISASNDPGLDRSAPGRPRPTPSAYVAKSWDYHVKRGARLHQRGKPRPRFRAVRESWSQAGRQARCWSTASISSTATRPTPIMRNGLRPRGCMTCRRALGRAVRHQWRHAAGRRSAYHRFKAVIASGIPGDRMLGIHAHMTTPVRPWPIHWPPLRPACARCRARINGIGERCGNANLTTHHPHAQAQAQRGPNALRSASRPMQLLAEPAAHCRATASTS